MAHGLWTTNSVQASTAPNFVEQMNDFEWIITTLPMNLASLADFLD